MGITLAVYLAGGGGLCSLKNSSTFHTKGICVNGPYALVTSTVSVELGTL